jgi:hypothetical protein
MTISRKIRRKSRRKIRRKSRRKSRKRNVPKSINIYNEKKEKIIEPLEPEDCRNDYRLVRPEYPGGPSYCKEIDHYDI